MGLLHGGGRNDFGDSLALQFSSERVARAVALRIRFGAMAGRFATFAKAWDQGSGPEIVHLGKGNLQPGSLALEIIKRLRQGRPPFLTVYTAVRIIGRFPYAVKILILTSCTPAAGTIC
jgi:hypothetical protein